MRRGSWVVLALAVLGLLAGLTVTLDGAVQVVDVYSRGQVFGDLLGGSPQGLVTTSPLRFLNSEFVIPLNRGPLAAILAHPFVTGGLVACLLCTSIIVVLSLRFVVEHRRWGSHGGELSVPRDA